MTEPTLTETLRYLGTTITFVGFVYTILRGVEYYIGGRYYQDVFRQSGFDMNLLDAMREYHYSKKSDD
jgi:hypothetical protein